MRTTFMALVSAAAGMALLSSLARAGDTSFCGRPTGEPAALQEAAAKDPALKEIYRGAEYIAYQETGAEAVYTFSQAAQGLAHPAAICRKPVKDGDNMIIQMVIVCRGETSSCQALESDFKLLNAQMEAEIRNKAADTAAKK